MQSRDVAECVRIVGTHPVIGPRYGKSIKDLGPAWSHVLECEAKSAAVIEEIDGSCVTICFTGLSVFVQDAFVCELKSPPLFWFGPELVRQITSRNSPMLSGKEVREANSCGGLNLVVWEGCVRPGFEKRLGLHQTVIGMFLQQHRGYLWKEVISSQIESVDRLSWVLNTGGRLWNPTERRYVESLDKDLQKIVKEPHVIGMTREAELDRPGSWVGTLFDYHPPQMGFSRGEQQLLVAALCGGTDEELSDRLGISLFTIKNTWRSIYNRTASHLPDLFSETSGANARHPPRGKEKRRHVLDYVRDHLEELRPVSRKLLKRAH